MTTETKTRIEGDREMKQYEYRTDAESGVLEAANLQEALEMLIIRLPFGPEVIADGAFGWVRDPETLETAHVPGTEANVF